MALLWPDDPITVIILVVLVVIMYWPEIGKNEEKEDEGA